MKFHEVEGVYADIQVAIDSKDGPQLPVNSAVRVKGEVAYMSRSERMNLIRALLGPTDE